MTRTSNRTWAHALATVAALAMACSAGAQDQAAGEPKASGQEETRAPDEKGILPIPEYGGDLWTRPALTGDWGGTRTDLANEGIQIGIDWVQTVQSIVDGGSQTTTRYGGSLDYLLYLDLYRMGVLPGALVKIRAETRYGESINKFAGPILPVDTDGFFPLSGDNIPFTITDLAYYQFLSEKFGVFLGKFDTLDGDPNPFASGRGNTQFLNSAFIYNPVAASSMPYSTLGAGVLKGKAVFELVDAEGHVYVMQARNEDHPIGSLATLGERMKQLPAGWKYRTRILTEDLVLDLTPDQTIYAVGDEFHQYYTRIAETK